MDRWTDAQMLRWSEALVSRTTIIPHTPYPILHTPYPIPHTSYPILHTTGPKALCLMPYLGFGALSPNPLPGTHYTQFFISCIFLYHISYIIYHMSYIIYHISYVICHMSYIIYHISYVICHMSYIIYHISYIIPSILPYCDKERGSQWVQHLHFYLSLCTGYGVNSVSLWVVYALCSIFSVLYAACCMLYAVCCMLYALCPIFSVLYILCAVCRMP
jgi:hypothetical protein